MGKKSDDGGFVSVYVYEPTESETVETWATSCAWCLSEAGMPMGNGSHGICPAHAAEMLAQAKERRKG